MARLITVSIPTFGRDRILVDTIHALHRQLQSGDELLVLDQTPVHEPDIEAALAQLDARQAIRWFRIARSSIPRSMNRALREARNEWVLFLDDDIIPADDLISTYREMSVDDTICAVAGQVLQPGEEPDFEPQSYRTTGFRAYLDFRFRSSAPAEIKNGMAGNLLVHRVRGLQIGGFDENYIGSAYRFETDFCRRLCEAGGRILFEPAASIRHLRVTTGGTRSAGSHLCSSSPLHGIGDYYFAFCHGRLIEVIPYCIKRFFKEVVNRSNLIRPWCVFVKAIGEIRAALMGYKYYRRGPKLLDVSP